MVSTIKQNHPRPIFLVKCPFYLVRNNIDYNGKQQWWLNWFLMYSNAYFQLSRKMCSNFHSCPCSFVQAQHCSNQCFKNSLLSYCPFHYFSRNSIKCFCQIYKNMYNFCCLAKYSSCIRLKMKTASIIHLPGITPNCISSIVTIFIIFSQVPFQQFPLHVLTISYPYACHTSWYLLLLHNRNCNTGSPVFWHTFISSILWPISINTSSTS